MIQFANSVRRRAVLGRPWLSFRRLLPAIVLAGLVAGLIAQTAGAGNLARLAWEIPAVLVAVVLCVDTIAGLLRAMPGVDIIALLAIAGALALSQDLAAVIIALMVTGGGALEDYARRRARHELAALLGRTPRAAHRETGDIIEDVSADAIQAGDRLLVKPGEIVPADGTIEDDAALLDESALTGEPLPVTRRRTDHLASGILNAGGPFRMVATATAEASSYATVVRLVQTAERERPPMVRMADRWALAFLAATLLVAALAWGVTDQPMRALAVLVVATPCPLILAAPVALICGISRAARRGIIIKNGGALERLARVRQAIFDKTGTVTTGVPRLARVVALDGFERDGILAFAASLEQATHHVVAAAIVAAAKAQGLRLRPPQGVTEYPGSGLSGMVGDSFVLVGTAGLLADAGIAIPTDGPAWRMVSAASSASWVVLDRRVAGALLLADMIRPEAARALRALRRVGLSRLVMASGDRAPAVEEIGAALGFDAVRAELSPADKIALVRAERMAGPTMMVGDGINDAPALAAANVGVAMGSRGAAAAAEAADIVLLVDRLDRLGEAVAVARRARWIAEQSIFVGIGLSLVAMGVAAFGYLPPIGGALLQEGIDVAVILNALRVLAIRAPSPLSDRTAVDNMVDEHALLRALLERMRELAVRLDDQTNQCVGELRAINARLLALVLPHQQAEEQRIYPELADRLGGSDPLRAMTHMHEEIANVTRRLDALVTGLSDCISAPEIHEAQRLLYVLDALIELHLAAEEDVISQVEDLPVRGDRSVSALDDTISS